jgi:hypothetical protein
MESNLSPDKNVAEKNKPNEFSELLKDWLRFSKTHGLDRLVLTKKPLLRLIWLLSLIASFGLCSFLIARIVTDYLRFEVKTRIREVYSEQMPFPKISVCNYNPLITPAANTFIREYFKNKYNLTVNKYADLYNKSIKFDPASELSYIAYLINEPGFNVTLRDSFGYNFLVQCTYNSKLCDPDSVIKYFDNTRGNCILINPKRMENGSERELFQAYMESSTIALVMFSGPAESESTVFLNDPLSGNKGMILRIEDADYDGIMLNSVGVSAGNQAEIVLSRTDTKNMPQPYSKCVKSDTVDTTVSRVMAQLNMTYNRRTCMQICRQIQNINTFGCNFMQNQIIPGYPLCTNWTEYVNSFTLQFNFSFCNDLCPIECDSVTYELSTSYTTWPTYDSYIWAKNNGIIESYFGTNDIDYEHAMKSFVGARIYYRAIKYTEIVETPSMTFVDLIAAIGGMMGLFLGFSIMIIVEIIELALEAMFIVCKSSFNRKVDMIQIRPEV